MKLKLLLIVSIFILISCSATKPVIKSYDNDEDLKKLFDRGFNSHEEYLVRLNDMLASGYSYSQNSAEVYHYLKDKYDGKKFNRTPKEQRLVRNIERLNEVEEVERNELDWRNVENQKKIEAEKSEKAKRDEKIKFLLSEYKRIDGIGNSICSGVNNISVGVAESLGKQLRLDSRLINFGRSWFEKNNVTSDTLPLMLVLANMNGGFQLNKNGQLQVECKIMIYTPRGPIQCKFIEEKIFTKTVVEVSNCENK